MSALEPAPTALEPARVAIDDPEPVAAAHASAPVPGFGLRCQAWLRDKHGLAFDAMHPSPSQVLVDGGACRAWRQRGEGGSWWVYAALCSLILAFSAWGAAARRASPDTLTVAEALAAAAFVGFALTSVTAWVRHRRDRETFAVAWDRGPRPLQPDERAQVLDGLRARWPKADAHWLITLRPAGTPHDEAGLVVFSVRAEDLPRISLGSRALD